VQITSSSGIRHLRSSNYNQLTTNKTRRKTENKKHYPVRLMNLVQITGNLNSCSLQYR